METFVYAIEATVNYITHRVSINVTDLQETENILKFMEIKKKQIQTMMFVIIYKIIINHGR